MGWMTSLFLFALSWVVLFPAVSPAAPLDSVSLQLRWFHQFQFAGYYTAKSKGFYRDVGLDVTIIERDLKVNPVHAVQQGNAQFGVTNSEILLHRMRGEPVVVMAAILQHSPLVLLTTKKDRISSPHDLMGKRVLMSTKTMDVELLGMLQKEHVPLGRLDIVDRFSSRNDYLDPSFDAVAAYITNQPYYLEEKGIAYGVLYPASYGVDFYGDCLFTTEDQVQNHPDRVRAFHEASLRGWQYAMAHPDEIIDLIMADYAPRKTKAHLEYEAAAIRKLMLPDLVSIGHMNPGRWAYIGQVFRSLGLTSTPLDMGSFLYSPNPVGDHAALKKFLYILGVVALVLMLGAISLGVFNRKLQIQVQQRTEALTLKALELERANQRLTELDRVKSALLSSVSHEIRTPMTAVLGFVKLIGKEFKRTFAPLAHGNVSLERKRDRISKNLNVISVEGERLTRLISDVLDLSKIESGSVHWQDQDIDMAEVAYNSVAVVQELFAQNPGTNLFMDVQDNLPRVHADPDRIIQVLINLLANAVKFTASGEVRLTLASDGAGHIEIVVSDTGIGIAQEDAEDIFNMFHQVRRGDTVRFGEQGAGLGLAICKEIVEHYGGSIFVHSALGQGSRFTVRLPAVVPKTEN